jgi:hypothetical protein
MSEQTLSFKQHLAGLHTERRGEVERAREARHAGAKKR